MGPWPDMTSLFSQLPAVLPLYVRQQPEQIGTGTHSRLNWAEVARDPGHDLVEHHLPAGRVHAVAHGHRTIFVCPHTSR